MERSEVKSELIRYDSLSNWLLLFPNIHNPCNLDSIVFANSADWEDKEYEQDALVMFRIVSG